MKLIFAEKAREDYLYWQKTDKNLLKRVNTLIKEIKRGPFEGVGKPEPLTGLDALTTSIELFIKLMMMPFSSLSYATTTSA